MNAARRAVVIALVVTLIATTAFTAAIGLAIVWTAAASVERVVGLLVALTSAVMLAAGLDGSVLHGRVTARVPAWALHGALPVFGVGAVGLSLLQGTQAAGALAGLLLLPAAAYIFLGLVSGTLLPRTPAPAAGKSRQRRGGRRQ